MKQDIPFWVWRKVSGNRDNNMVRVSQWRESQCRTNTSVRKKKKIQMSRTVRVTVRIQVTIWVRSFEIESSKNKKLYLKKIKAINRGKRSNTLSELKPVKNISKKHRVSSRQVSCKRRSFLHINCKAMHLRSRIYSD